MIRGREISEITGSEIESIAQRMDSAERAQGILNSGLDLARATGKRVGITTDGAETTFTFYEAPISGNVRQETSELNKLTTKETTRQRLLFEKDQRRKANIAISVVGRTGTPHAREREHRNH